MHFSLAVAPALFFGFAAAAAVNSAEKCSATDPTNPQNLINCPPNGGADGYHLETKLTRYTLASRTLSAWYFSPLSKGTTTTSDGKRIEIDNKGTC
ncbi:hypothetical protein K525DRAFT_281951 [Schizophyllum commune Loenen D]|nr:hypothetical protein K525DRAFT_281951 [Schizophyllum commune Loenen D]